MADDDKRVTLRLPADVHAAILRLAREHRRSLNAELVVAVLDYVQRQPPPPRKRRP